LPGTWIHLAKRYWEGLRSKPLTSVERLWVDGLLAPSERAAFYEQSAVDQRHGYSAAQVVSAAPEANPSVVRAALLHDIGKRHARLGLMGRVWASLAIRLRLPLWGRVRRYRNHGPIGARELQQWGAESLVVEFARTHHGSRPPLIEPEVWKVLCQSDKAQK